MVNRVYLIGNLGNDPELRETQNGTALCLMSLATNETRMKDGERQTLTEWHKVVVWGKQAESCSEYLKKGSKAHVEGRIQTRIYEPEDGDKKYFTEIVADRVTFL